MADDDRLDPRVQRHFDSERARAARDFGVRPRRHRSAVSGSLLPIFIIAAIAIPLVLQATRLGAADPSTVPATSTVVSTVMPSSSATASIAVSPLPDADLGASIAFEMATYHGCPDDVPPSIDSFCADPSYPRLPGMRLTARTLDGLLSGSVERFLPGLAGDAPMFRVEPQVIAFDGHRVRYVFFDGGGSEIRDLDLRNGRDSLVNRITGVAAYRTIADPTNAAVLMAVVDMETRRDAGILRIYDHDGIQSVLAAPRTDLPDDTPGSPWERELFLSSEATSLVVVDCIDLECVARTLDSRTGSPTSTSASFGGGPGALAGDALVHLGCPGRPCPLGAIDTKSGASTDVAVTACQVNTPVAVGVSSVVIETALPPRCPRVEVALLDIARATQTVLWTVDSDDPAAVLRLVPPGDGAGQGHIVEPGWVVLAPGGDLFVDEPVQARLVRVEDGAVVLLP